jgi:glycosyltransferase involved in cell wall biosynthesis
MTFTPSKANRISIVIPAWNEELRLGETLRALHEELWASGKSIWNEIIVVDDGSTDHTYQTAYPLADQVIRHARRKGKGQAMESGWRAASGDIVVFLDADLGATANQYRLLAEPLLADRADLSTAIIASPKLKSGFGLARGLARRGIRSLTGYYTVTPLSGQRAIRKPLIQSIAPLSGGFGVEVGMTIDALRQGARVCEVKTGFRHREMSNNWAGMLHRGRQWLAIARVLLTRAVSR